jgi:hypothetical protein
MATMIGAGVGVSTWGKFRCAMILNDDYGTGGVGFSVNDHNIDYLAGVGGQKASASGSGLIRYPRLTFLSNFAQQPSIFSAYSGLVPPVGNRLLGIPGTFTEGFKMPTEVRTELEGEIVTLTGLSATFTSTFFTTNTQFIGGGSPAQPIVSIGKLTAF